MVNVNVCRLTHVQPSQSVVGQTDPLVQASLSKRKSSLARYQ